jgi:hypothetical protein
MQFTRAGRLAAAVIAIAAWAGLGLYLVVEAKSQGGDWPGAVWTNLGFLTDLTNLLLAVVMTGVALGMRPLSRPHVVGWVVSAIATVGLGFLAVGGQLVIGKSALENVLLHGVTPWLALLVWVAFAPKGGLRWRKALFWVVWPVGYFSYALIRGALTGTYAYGFIDPAKSSAIEIATVVGMMAAIMAVWTLVLLGLDRLMGRRP